MILFKAIHSNYVSTWDKYKETTSFKNGARWNSPGVPAMYTSTNPQNAMLEIANYINSPAMVNKLYRIAVFEFPSLRLHKIDLPELPSNWYDISKPAKVKLVGDSYLKNAKYDGIQVPSITINRDIATHPINAIREAVYANVVVNLDTIGVGNIKLIDSYSPVYSSNMFK
ncbi:MAG: hypothetical protein CML22_06970 [Rheinheimera sp.]|nr:hypothetical protein [Rheinheimera sp.]MBM34025.1 hypothetical protein [Rheinheimera sp.]|tara:strand:- start:6567 stop:7076 length:510 start_codon:yes stop_codon:yes gene_type:complete